MHTLKGYSCSGEAGLRSRCRWSIAELAKERWCARRVPERKASGKRLRMVMHEKGQVVSQFASAVTPIVRSHTSTSRVHAVTGYLVLRRPKA